MSLPPLVPTYNDAPYQVTIVFPGDRRLRQLRSCDDHIRLLCVTYPEGMVAASPAEETPLDKCDVCRFAEIRPVGGADTVSPHTLPIMMAHLSGRVVDGLYVCHFHFHSVVTAFSDTRGGNTGPRTRDVKCDVCRLLEANRFPTSGLEPSAN